MFYDKLNYKEDGFYSVVDQVELVNGEYKGVLNHDHVDRGTILIIDEEGNEIKDYFISDNPEKPWETEIELFGSKGIKIAYIHYNTKGDIVDADDINKIQDAINTDDNSLEKVKEDIIVLKETKSDKRYVDKELEKKLDNDNFLEAMEEITEYTNNDLIPELKQYADDLFADIPEVFHDLNQNVVTEDMNPGDFKHGVTICSQSSIDSFPSIKEYGVSITVRGVHASYAQLFITRYGDIWARRSGVIGEWNGDWYNSKKEIDKKADKDYVDEKIGDIDFTELEEKIDKKADKSELDKVKQSGVETNKILVDALNSHDIQASTKDSIKINANRVNDIKTGVKVPMTPTNDLITIGNQREKHVELKWSSPKNVICNGITITEFKEDVLIRNKSRIPINITDGVQIGSFEKNKHKYTPFLDKDIEFDTQYYYAVFSVATNNTIIKNGEGKILVEDGMTIGQLPTGALIQDTNSKYYDKPIVWRKLADDHPGYPKNSTTLLSEHILCLKASDGKESDNPDKNRSNQGNNRYIYSNLRQWLNSSESDWFIEQHAYDMPPIGFAVTHNYYYDGFQGNRNGEKGFMTNLSTTFKKSIIPTNLQILKNKLDGGGLETATDKIFLLSCTEVGLNNGTSYSEGVRFDYFANNSNKITYPTQEAINNSTYIDSNLSTSKGWGWWLRTPYNDNFSNGATIVRVVDTGGNLKGEFANEGTQGVRPAVNLNSDTAVSPKPNSNGVYELIF